MLYRHLRLPAAGALIAVLLFGMAQPAGAQEFAVGASTVTEAAAGPVGPDQFGYLATSAPLQWVDATGGTDVFAAYEESGYVSQSVTETVALPFDFPFYQIRYSAVVLHAAGYVTFSPGNTLPDLIDRPLAGLPNTVAAVYQGDFSLARFDSSTKGRVFTLVHGEAPNRSLVIEWHRMSDFDRNAELTFQMVLEEDGDIVFNYQTMYPAGTGPCAGIGIQNSPAWDGLNLNRACTDVASNSAFRITRPPEGAHLLIYAPTAARHAPLGGEAVFEFTVQNTGDQQDHFNFSAATAVPLRFVDANGKPLADTNGDGKPDTGLLYITQRAIVGAVVRMPLLGNSGTQIDAAVAVTSARDPAVQRVLPFRALVPPRFVQRFGVQSGSTPAHLQLAAVQPIAGAQPVIELGDLPADAAIATRPGAGYVAVWSGGRVGDALFYSFLAGDGAVQGGLQVLQPPSSSNEFYESPVVAVAPDGRVGVAWIGVDQRIGGFEELSWYHAAIYFAVIDADGTILAPPVALAGPGSDDYYHDPGIAATADNRFAVVWHWARSGSYSENVQLALLSTQGASVHAVQDLDFRSMRPVVTGLENGNLVVAYDDDSAQFAVFNSAGEQVRAPAVLTPPGPVAAAAGIGGNGLLLVWSEYEYTVQRPRLYYTVLDATTFAVRTPPTPLPVENWANYPQRPQVVVDDAGNGIISVATQNGLHQMVAAVAPTGALLMPVTDFAPLGLGQVFADLTIGVASGSVLRSAISPTSLEKADPVLRVEGASAGVPDRLPAVVTVGIENRGAQIARSAALVATLDPGVSYVGAEPPPSSVSGASGATSITWALPDLALNGGGRVTLQAHVPPAAVGASVPLTFTLTTATPVVDEQHGRVTVQLTGMLPYFLPTVTR